MFLRMGSQLSPLDKFASFERRKLHIIFEVYYFHRTNRLPGEKPMIAALVSLFGVTLCTVAVPAAQQGWLEAPLISALSGLVGVFLGAVISLFGQWWAERRSRQRQASYLAIRVLCVLDEFVYECTEVADDQGMAGPNDSYEPTKEHDPNAPSFPNDVDWKSIDSALAYDILSLPHKINIAQRSIELAETRGEDFEEWQYQYVILGLDAANLAAKLRKECKIAGRDMASAIDTMEKVKKAHEAQRNADNVDAPHGPTAASRPPHTP